MRNSVSVSLPNVLLKELKSRSRSEHTHRSEIVRKSLREYFFRTEFARLRRKMSLEVARRGTEMTEEEIFREIS